jgi:hypothetical protein
MHQSSMCTRCVLFKKTLGVALKTESNKCPNWCVRLIYALSGLKSLSKPRSQVPNICNILREGERLNACLVRYLSCHTLPNFFI